MNIFISIAIIIFGYILAFSSNNISKKDRNILMLLWLYHLIFGVYYYFFIRADSYSYFLNATGRMTSQDFWEYITTSGTGFINAICFLLVNIGLSSYFSLILFFSLIGYIGMVLLYKTILSVIPTNPQWGKIQLFPFLLFLPNLHLWSVAVGKDSLLFFLIALFVYSLLHLEKRFLWLIFSVFVAYHIRPHLALILVISLGMASLFRKGVTGFMDQSAEGLSYGGSAVDISGYPYPLKVFTFIYRPFFFDINGIPSLIISFENLLLLLLTIQVFRKQPIKTFKNAPFTVQFALCFFVLGVLVFSGVVSNVGNIIRQRNMFTPSLLLYVLWSFSYYSIHFNKKMPRTKV
jgi:hypothetical protein